MSDKHPVEAVISWTPEQDFPDIEHACGHAFGYRLTLEAHASGRWCARLLNQVAAGTAETMDGAKLAASQLAARWLLETACCAG